MSKLELNIRRSVFIFGTFSIIDIKDVLIQHISKKLALAFSKLLPTMSSIFGFCALSIFP